MLHGQHQVVGGGGRRLTAVTSPEEKPDTLDVGEGLVGMGGAGGGSSAARAAQRGGGDRGNVGAVTNEDIRLGEKSEGREEVGGVGGKEEGGEGEELRGRMGREGGKVGRSGGGGGGGVPCRVRFSQRSSRTSKYCGVAFAIYPPLRSKETSRATEIAIALVMLLQ